MTGLIIGLIIFFCCVALAIYFKLPSTRGKRGEKKVRRIIGETIENKQYVINDIILVTDGKSSQIDHIVINPRGIFVIETKNYSGRIYGKENHLQWTQVLSYGKVKNHFYNPLKQNATHIYTVRKLIDNLPVRSLVVFVQNNTQYIEANNVIKLSDLAYELQKGDTILTPPQMSTAYNKLLAAKADITTKEHVQNIIVEAQRLADNICPRCGADLVQRQGKHGQFWGCSNYPKCKFIKKV